MPPAQDLGQRVTSVNSYCTIILECLVVRDLNIISAKLRCLHPMFSSVILVRWVGGKLSRLVYLAPAQDLGQAVSSVNSYCTIILEYLVVRDINIISVKLKCLHPMFSLVILVRGVGDKLSRLVYLAPPPPSRIWVKQCHQLNLIAPYLGIFSCKRCEHYFSQIEMFTSKFSLVILVRGVGGKLSRLVYLAPRPGFGSNSVISQLLLHHNLGIFSCKRYKHYFSQTEMFISNVQFGYLCSSGGGQAVQAGLSCPPSGFGSKSNIS